MPIPATAPAGPMPLEGQGSPRTSRLMALLREILEQYREHLLANIIFLVALVIGFLHGWLKMRYRHPLTTFAYDIPMAIALMLVILRIPRGKNLFPDCGVSTGLKLLVVCCLIYCLLPFDVPWLARISSFRGWCFAPLMMLLGYHLVRTVRQMETFVWAVILLGTGTAIYGIFFQTAEEIRQMMALDPELEFKLRGNFYSTSQGASEFRRFSTYVSSAVFGSTMAICTMFSTSRLLTPGVGWIQRGILAVASALCAYAVILTGSRTSLVLLASGLILNAVFSRGAARFIVAPLIFSAVVLFGIKVTQGAAAERFATLFNASDVYGRIRIVANPALNLLTTYPMGGGLGRSGHGVPFVFYQSIAGAEMRLVDGDFGRLIVDMGIVGAVIYVVLLYTGLSDSIRWMWKMRESNLSVISAPAGGLFLLGLLQVFTGSPYLGIPAGMLLWILFGGLRRMMEEYERLAVTEGDMVEDLPQFISFIQRRRISSLYAQAPRTVEVARTGRDRGRTASANRPGETTGRRLPFLFKGRPQRRR